MRRKNSFLNFVFNRFGFSMIEVLVAAGVLGAVSVGTLKMISSQQTGIKDTIRRGEETELIRMMQTRFNDKQVCTHTLIGICSNTTYQTQSACESAGGSWTSRLKAFDTPFGAIKGRDGSTDLYKGGQQLGFRGMSGKSVVEIATNGFQLVNTDSVAAGQQGVLSIEVTINRLGKLGALSSSITKSINFVGKLSGTGTLQECHADRDNTILNARAWACSDVGGVWNSGNCDLFESGPNAPASVSTTALVDKTYVDRMMCKAIGLRYDGDDCVFGGDNVSTTDTTDDLVDGSDFLCGSGQYLYDIQIDTDANGNRQYFAKCATLQQSCPTGTVMTGMDDVGNAVCSSVCAAGEFAVVTEGGVNCTTTCDNNDVLVAGADGVPVCRSCNVGQVAIVTNDGFLNCVTSDCADGAFLTGFDDENGQLQCSNFFLDGKLAQCGENPVTGEDYRYARMAVDANGMVEVECCDPVCDSDVGSAYCPDQRYPTSNDCGYCRGADGDPSKEWGNCTQSPDLLEDRLCVGLHYPTHNGCKLSEDGEAKCPGEAPTGCSESDVEDVTCDNISWADPDFCGTCYGQIDNSCNESAETLATYCAGTTHTDTVDGCGTCTGTKVATYAAWGAATIGACSMKCGFTAGSRTHSRTCSGGNECGSLYCPADGVFPSTLSGQTSTPTESCIWGMCGSNGADGMGSTFCADSGHTWHGSSSRCYGGDGGSDKCNGKIASPYDVNYPEEMTTDGYCKLTEISYRDARHNTGCQRGWVDETWRCGVCTVDGGVKLCTSATNCTSTCGCSSDPGGFCELEGAVDRRCDTYVSSTSSTQSVVGYYCK